MDGAIALVAGHARVEVDAAIGGALAAFTFRGVDVLRPTPAGTHDVRLHACYPLVPYSNRIANACLAFDGRAYELARNFGDHPHAIHCVGWQRPWMIAAHDASSALLALDHEAEGAYARAWPWRLRAAQSLSLHAAREGMGAVLEFKLTIANPGASEFPFGLGWHPFFARRAGSRLGFRARGVWETDETRMPTVHAAVPRQWRFDPAREPGTATIDNVFTGWDGEASLIDGDRNMAVSLRADRAMGFLVMYAPKAAGFVALEPVTHMTDAFNRAARGERDTGTRVLEPGGAFSCTMEIEVRTLP
jgi:aldose 1-epimerase